MFACPVLSYITNLSPAREKMNFKSKFVYSVIFHFMSTIFIFVIEPGVSICVYICFVSLAT